jgi:hypothetical protein
MLSGPKLKSLNKETVSWALLDSLNLPAETIGEIIEIVWRSDELLEAHQLAAQQSVQADVCPECRCIDGHLSGCSIFLSENPDFGKRR